jgi:hypothetical protein
VVGEDVEWSKVRVWGLVTGVYLRLLLWGGVVAFRPWYQDLVGPVLPVRAACCLAGS